MIALLIGYESVERLANPVPIAYGEAIAIAVLGLAVNLGSAWLLGGEHHHHGHAHHHDDQVTTGTPTTTITGTSTAMADMVMKGTTPTT